MRSPPDQTPSADASPAHRHQAEGGAPGKTGSTSIGSRTVVVDLETRPDREASSFVGGAGAISRWCLHRIAAASVLVADEDAHGYWSEFRLESWCEPEHSEEKILEGLSAALSPVVAGHGVLLTYNGLAHDVEVLRRRAAHHLRPDLVGLTRLRALGPNRHRDLFRIVRGGSGDRAPTLSDVCAGLGLDTDHGRMLPGRIAAPAPVRKSQVDVVATFVVDLYERALDEEDAGIVVRGWDGLAAFLRERRRSWPHLAQFWRHPLVAEGRPASSEC